MRDSRTIIWSIAVFVCVIFLDFQKIRDIANMIVFLCLPIITFEVVGRK